MINAGFKNYINEQKAIGVIDFSTRTDPVQKLIIEGRKIGLVIDATMGRRTNSVIFMENGYIILSNLTSSTVSKRIEEANKNACSAKKTKEKISG